MASILTVDDSASIRQMVTYTLESTGHHVIEAIDGLDALKRAHDHKVDLVITDINMPNMDGIAFIKELRALPSYKYIPILLLTTESSAEKKMEGKSAGATGWLVKPFDPEKLLATLRRILG